jgi:cation diffusion facilitator family transporter
MSNIMDMTTRSAESQRATFIGGAKNIFLAVIKIVFGITGHSHALFADGIHSLSDLLIDGLVLIASRFGSKAADHEHPYGHGRIETAATVLLAFVLSLAGIAIIWDASFKALGLHAITQPSIYVLFVALFSVLINEVLYRYTKHISNKIASKLLLTNAWHHRSDAWSSLVVLLGAGCAWLGFAKLDAVAAIIVGLMIIKMAWQFGWSSIQELIDTGLDDVTLTKIKKTIVAVPGVRALHQLRTRSLAGKIFLDVHILVEPMLSVSEGHFLGQQVHYRLLESIPDLADVTVHVDPENDEIVAPSRDLPSRAEIIELLKNCWGDLIDNNFINKIVIHYLGGKIYINLYLPLILSNETLTTKLQAAIKDKIIIAKLTIYFF